MIFYILATGLVGCGDIERHSPEPKKLRIAVIPKAESHIFWKTVQAGALKATQDMNCEVIWKGPDKEDDRNSQVQTVQNFTVKKVDAIALAPVDGDVLQKSAEHAVEAGIKVVIFDSALKSGDRMESFVATDNYKGGQLCGEELALQLGGQGKVIMLRMQEGSLSTTLREQGFLDALKEKGPLVVLLSVDVYGGSSVGSAQKKAQLLLSKYADQVTGIFCPNETTTEAMLLTLKQMGLAGKVKFVGFDCNPAILTAIRLGEINASASQSPFNMGYLSVATAYKALRGEPFEKRVDTGVTLVKRDNIDSPHIQAIVNPDLSKVVKF